MTPGLWFGLFLLLVAAPWLAAWSMRFGSERLREREGEE